MLTEPLPLGTIVGHYKILNVLGQGGFGITYLAYDQQLKRNVVLKENVPMGICKRDSSTGAIVPLHPQFEGLYADSLAIMQQEAETIASLNHDRIVRIYDVFRSGTGLFYVMPWLEGGSLRNKLDAAAVQGVPMIPAEVEAWLVWLLEGLEYLHAKGICHRDIKPSNILFDESGRPVLIDFGAALNVLAHDGTVTQGACSFGYAPPEQLTGKGEVGPWSDLYALAATMYEVVARIPTEHANRRLMHDDVIPLGKLMHGGTWRKQLLQSIDFNLSLHPESRCQQARQWSEWLTQGKEAKRKGQSNRTAWLVSASIVVLLCLGLWASNWDTAPSKTTGKPPTTQTAPTSPNAPRTEPTTPHNLTEDLYQRAYAYYKIDDLLAKIRALKQGAKELKEKLRADVEREKQKALKAIAEATEVEEKKHGFDGLKGVDYKEVFDSMDEGYRVAHHAISERFRSEVTYRRNDIEDDIMANFPVHSIEETALLPIVLERISALLNKEHAEISIMSDHSDATLCFSAQSECRNAESDKLKELRALIQI